MKKLFVIIAFLFQTSAHGVSAVEDHEGAEEIQIAYFLPFYKATKKIKDREVTLKILGSMHTLSKKVIPEEVMNEIMDSSLLINEIEGSCIHGEAEVDLMDTALDYLFNEESKVTPDVLRSNTILEFSKLLGLDAEIFCTDVDFFQKNFRWSQSIPEDQENIYSILKELLEEKGRKDDIELLHRNGLDSLNSEMLNEVLDMRLKSLNIHPPKSGSYGLGFFQYGGMDHAIIIDFKKTGKKILAFETEKDRVNIKKTTESSPSFEEKLKKMRGNASPMGAAKELHKKLSGGNFKIMNGHLVPVKNKTPYKSKPAYTNSYCLLSEKYFSGKNEPNMKQSVIFRNRLWHKRFMGALEDGSIKENKISIVVGAGHLLGKKNFLKLIEESGFYVENCTPGLSLCKKPSLLYADHFYFPERDRRLC